MKRITEILSDYNSARLKVDIRKDDELLYGFLTVLVGSDKNGVTFVTEIPLLQHIYDTAENREAFHGKVEKYVKSPHKIVQTIIQKALHPLYSSNSGETDITYGIEMLDISPIPVEEWKLERQYLFKFGVMEDEKNNWKEFTKFLGGDI